jgi:hypothetical protein
MNIQQMVDWAALLKEKIATQTEELRKVNLELVKQAEFKDGAKTGHAYGQHYSAKVQLKENVKWDQDKLAGIRSAMGDAEFFKVLTWKFEPKNAKTLAGALEFGQHKELIEGARTVTEGSPTVTFERLESV